MHFGAWNFTSFTFFDGLNDSVKLLISIKKNDKCHSDNTRIVTVREIGQTEDTILEMSGNVC